MKSSVALRKARKLIESESCQYVCFALDNVRGAKHTDVKKRLSRLFPERSVMLWLIDHGFDVWGASNAARLAYRLRWIDWMIIGYEAVGD